MSSILTCNNVTKSYRLNMALENFTINLESGKIIGLLGPNGSGKSTLIKILAGVLRCDSGEVLIDGSTIGIKTKSIVSYLPERTYFPTDFKVKETIKMFKDFYLDFNEEKAYDMLQKLDIDTNARIKQLSKGTREKLQLVLVMSRNARLYLLDEPMGGVDPAARDYVLKTIIQNYNEEASVLISTHQISDVEKVLDEAVFIKYGQLVLHKNVDDIRAENGKSVDSLFREVFAC